MDTKLEKEEKIAFIHIGKCGGTSLVNQISKYNIYQYHIKNKNDICKSEKNIIYDPINEKYIIWIRHPLSRFVSAFNMIYTTLNTVVNPNIIYDRQNSVCPEILINKLKYNRDYYFSKINDTLILKHTSANELAENITSDNPEKKKDALELMNLNLEHCPHILKGIGYYLYNGDFIKEHNDKILFVGKLETMEEDCTKLNNLLNMKLNSTIKLRENKQATEGMKYLSPLAIKNLLEWYKDTDYAALNQLYLKGWITKEVFDSYHTYTLA